MSIVHTNNIKEEMVLSEDVVDITGRLLLQKGHKLNPGHVKIIQKWGITEVSIVDMPENQVERSEPVNPPKISNRIMKETKRIFHFADLDHPAMKELFRLSLSFRNEHDHQESITETALTDAKGDGPDPSIDIIKKMSEKDFKLPEIPNIVFELNQIISNPLSTADCLAQVVLKSPSLATILLKIVNSSYYSFNSKIDTISRAVTLIGTKEICSLALLICTISVFKEIPKGIVDMHSFLKHSFSCGLISRMLAANRNMPQTEQLFIAGMLHDIGRVIVYKHFPEQAKTLLTQCLDSESLLVHEEEHYIGCKHTDIADQLLHAWNFPSEIADNIIHHHDPMAASDPRQATIIHLADIIVNGLGIGTSGEQYVPPLQSEAWENLGLPPSSFEVIIDQAIHQLSALEPFLND